jgi:hypothetical protein
MVPLPSTSSLRHANFTVTALSCLLLLACSKAAEQQTSATPSATPEAQAPIPPTTTEPTTTASAPELAASKTLDTELATLRPDELSINSANAKAYLEKYFKDECSKDERLSFEQACQHYPEASPGEEEDPSPWPDLMIGINNKQIVGAAVLNSTFSLGKQWQCETAKEFEEMRFCYPQKTSQADKERWSKEWAAYFATAD